MVALLVGTELDLEFRIELTSEITETRVRQKGRDMPMFLKSGCLTRSRRQREKFKLSLWIID